MHNQVSNNVNSHLECKMVVRVIFQKLKESFYQNYCKDKKKILINFSNKCYRIIMVFRKVLQRNNCLNNLIGTRNLKVKLDYLQQLYFITTKIT